MGDHFINAATGLLVRDLEAIINDSPELVNDPTVTEAFSAFRQTCTVMPSIVDYVSSTIRQAGRERAFTPDQLELLMLAMIARSSSTYGTIPGVVAHLALIGEHADAAILNENAKNETGDRAHAPHPTLLYDCFSVLGEAFAIPALSPARYHLMRIILLGREQEGRLLSDVGEVQAYLAEADLHVPAHNQHDVLVALRYAEKYGPELIRLHSTVIEVETRFNERDDAPSSRNPYDLGWIALRCLELAMREASSVDEHDTGQFSYIGAWGQVIDHLVSHLPSSDIGRARAWVEAHNDEIAGQAVGWEGAAEEGHAEDARVQAVKIMAKLPPKTFGMALAEVTKLNSLRLRFWDDVVGDLQRLEATDLALKPIIAAE